jgi:8-oxo-dGTP pyrophosphatase MutT (NUDIX family)
MFLFLQEKDEDDIKGRKVRSRAEVLVIKGAKLLVGKYDKSGPRGKYLIPGGGIGKSENERQAARRECREEISTICMLTTKLGKARYDWPDIYGGRDPKTLSADHIKWLENENLAAEIVHTYLAEYVGESTGEGGPADDKYEPIEITFKEFREWVSTQEDDQPWMKQRRDDLYKYIKMIEDEMEFKINEDHLIFLRESKAHKPMSRERAIELMKSLGEDVDIDELMMGVAIELEHGIAAGTLNITDDNDLETIKIALVHLREIPDYYSRLKKMENDAEGNKS